MPKLYGALRLLVPSDDDPAVEYLVDLASYKGNGRCTCRNFECERWTLIRDAKAERKFKPGDKTRCKHLRRAREFVVSDILGCPGDLDWLDIVIAEWIRRFGPNSNGGEE